MPIPEININELVAIKKTYRARWRLPVIFLLLIFLFALSQKFFNYPQPGNPVLIWIMFFLMILIYGLSFLIGEKTQRLTYLLLSSATFFLGAFYLAVQFEDFWMGNTFFYGVLFIGVLTLPKSLLLFKSIHYSLGESLRNQIKWSYEVVWKMKSVNRKKLNGGRRRESSKPGFLFFLFGPIIFLLGLLFWFVLGCALFFREDTVYSFPDSQFILFIYEKLILLNLEDIFQQSILVAGALIFGCIFGGGFSFELFGFLWNRWKLSQVEISNDPISEIMSYDDVLYLRSFEKEVKSIGTSSLSKLPFTAYGPNFSLERLIAERLRFLGNLYALGSPKDKYPPDIAIRFYIRDNWESEILKAMKKAKIIIMIAGESSSLMEELSWINERDYLDKTLIIFPYSLDKDLLKAYQAVLNHLFVVKDHESIFPSINISRVMGLCFHEGNPVVITGRKRNELFYQSVVELGCGFILNDENYKQGILRWNYSIRWDRFPDFIWKFLLSTRWV
ncbi:MAG: hypothetical protein JXR03_21045 [Cyclobacteriaceae bacterium]